jgi:hypothetical protein
MDLPDVTAGVAYPVNQSLVVYRWATSERIQPLEASIAVMLLDHEAQTPDEFQIGFYDPVSMQRAEVVQNGVPSLDQSINVELSRFERLQLLTP